MGQCGLFRDDWIRQGRGPRQESPHPSDDEAFYADLWSTIAVGNVWRGEITNRRKDEILYAEEMTITPVPSSGQEISHFVAIQQDTTERRHAEQELRLTQFSLEHASDAIHW